jgi:hypothetical protein
MVSGSSTVIARSGARPPAACQAAARAAVPLHYEAPLRPSSRAAAPVFGTLVIVDRRTGAAPITDRTAFGRTTAPAGRDITVLRA